MAKLYDYDEDKNKTVIKELGRIKVSQLPILLKGEYEVAVLLNDEALIINIAEQHLKRTINPLATSILNQKVYGPVILLNKEERRIL